MKKLLLITLCMNAMISFSAMASQAVTIKVDGLVCDFCAQALNKVFMAREGVEAIHVDLDKGIVAVNLKQGSDIDDDTLTKLITDSGYNVSGIIRGSDDATTQ